MSACKNCGREVRFVRTVTGKSMPIDPEPNDIGNVVLVNDVAHVLRRGEERPDLGERYMPHFGSCEALS